MEKAFRNLLTASKLYKFTNQRINESTKINKNENLLFWKIGSLERSKRFRNNNFQSIGRFPKIEQYGITNQIRRVTFSISANIAEGISRKTNADKARFINQAYSSSIEVLNFLIISHELTWIETEKYIELRKKIESITNKLNSFYNKLKNNDNLTT